MRKLISIIFIFGFALNIWAEDNLKFVECETANYLNKIIKNKTYKLINNHESTNPIKEFKVYGGEKNIFYYQGFIIDGLFNQEGKLSIFDGNTFDGEWNKGQFEGKGIYISNCGNCNSFGHISNIQIEKITLYSITGCKYSGQWRDNKPDGDGQVIVYLESNKFINEMNKVAKVINEPIYDIRNYVIKGHWKNGKLVSGKIMVGNYETRTIGYPNIEWKCNLLKYIYQIEKLINLENK